MIRGTSGGPLPLLSSEPGGICRTKLHEARNLSASHSEDGRNCNEITEYCLGERAAGIHNFKFSSRFRGLRKSKKVLAADSMSKPLQAVALLLTVVCRRCPKIAPRFKASLAVGPWNSIAPFRSKHLRYYFFAFFSATIAIRGLATANVDKSLFPYVPITVNPASSSMSSNSAWV